MNQGDTIVDFVKMSGAGNDFVLIDARERALSLDGSMLARIVCDRHYGVGGDGLLLLEEDRTADFSLEYYNADGSTGSMCGNGGRCAASYVMQAKNLRSVSFHCCEFLYTAQRVGTNVIRLSMKECGELRMNLQVEVANKPLRVHFIDTGAPHAVVLAEEIPQDLKHILDTEGIESFARSIRYAQQFAPNGANVDILTVVGDATISLRTYEKGVEAETLACGTGALASAMVGSIIKKLQPPITVVPKSGEKLQVSFGREGEHFTHVELEGPADVIFSGQYRVRSESTSGANRGSRH